MVQLIAFRVRADPAVLDDGICTSRSRQSGDGQACVASVERTQAVPSNVGEEEDAARILAALPTDLGTGHEVRRPEILALALALSLCLTGLLLLLSLWGTPPGGNVKKLRESGHLADFWGKSLPC